MESGTYEFSAPRDSSKSPLAKSLFRIDGITRVFYGPDFISVTKSEDMDWNVLKPEIYGVISSFFSYETPLFTDSPEHEDTTVKEDDSEVVAIIKEILETRVRPSVQEDGGDIEYLNFNEHSGIVTLAMKGACVGCSSSSSILINSGVTLKNGIEKMLMYYVPEVKEVVSQE